MRKAARPALVALWAAVLPSCAGHYDLRELPWPLYYTDVGGRAHWGAWPFVEKLGPDEDGRGDFFAIHPILSTGRLEGTGARFVDALYPFFLYTSRPDTSTLSIFPLFYRLARDDARGKDRDYLITPLLGFGSEPGEGGYFFLIPIGGVMKGKLGKERVEFVLFPLYTSSRKGRIRSWTYLWPFIEFKESPSARSGRFWPFFGRSVTQGAKGVAEKSFFVLWPLYTRTTHFPDDPERRSVAERVLLVAWQTGPEVASFRLFPLFDYVRAKEKDEKPVLKKTGLFPFFWRQVWADRTVTQILWPLGYFVRENGEDFTREDSHIMPFFFRIRREGKPDPDPQAPPERKEAWRDGFTKVWPLWQEKEDRDGASKAEVLSPFFRLYRTRFRRNFEPFWQFYTHEKAPRGRTFEAHSLFGRLFVRERDARQSLFRLAPLVTTWTDPKGSGTSILMGLVRVRTTPLGQKKIRLFFLPEF